MDALLQQQVRVSKMLGVGFACSLLGVGGVSSVVALIIGLKARRLIKDSKGELVGIAMAWWCIVVGALGLLTLPLLIYFLIKVQNPATRF
jgi:apolipoprotein N-acyltransferase